ncbi:hypothetical protein ACVW1A_007187 [Bradyrhizobium sp. LB1.3]
MNAPAKIIDGKALEDAIWLLETRALIRAYLDYEYQFEHLADAIDPLQEFAEQSGLVAAIGQDEVQRLVAKPFQRFRKIVAAQVADELADAGWEPDLPSDYASQLVMQWELADPRDRWRWTGEQPPTQQASATEKLPYRTPQSTIDSFYIVMSENNPERLAEWVRNHPDDALAVLEMLEAT